MGASTTKILRPFDTHVHGRQGALLRTVAPLTARQFRGAIFEPNLAVPVTTRAQGQAYRSEIREATSAFSSFDVHVLAYLTDSGDPEDLHEGLTDDTFIGGKFYPQGATTNSENGIVDVSTLWKPGTRQYHSIRAIAMAGKVAQLHCELNYDLDGRELDPYDKEPYFFRQIMPRLLEAHPDVKWSCEHLTCAEGVAFMRRHGGLRLGCSITPHHLLYDRRDMFRGGLRPHLFCLPVIKASEHQEALLALATDGLGFVYAGTDSAPHDRRKKECDCCSGGVFTAHAAVELYAMVFENYLGSINDRFEAFMAMNGPAFYGLKLSEETMELQRSEWTVDELLEYSDNPEDVIWSHGYDKDPKQRLKLSFRTT